MNELKSDSSATCRLIGFFGLYTRIHASHTKQGKKDVRVHAVLVMNSEASKTKSQRTIRQHQANDDYSATTAKTTLRRYPTTRLQCPTTRQRRSTTRPRTKLSHVSFFIYIPDIIHIPLWPYYLPLTAVNFLG